MTNIMKEETTKISQHWPIDRRNRTSDERPLVLTIHRHSRIGVVEVRQHHDPVVDELETGQ